MRNPSAGRVLVIGAPAAEAEALAALLRPRFDVAVVADSAGAIAHVLSGPAPDLLLLDGTAEGDDGTASLGRLQSEPETRHLPVLAVTARGDGTAETRALEAGAADCVAKPVTQAVLLRRVADLLAKPDPCPDPRPGADRTSAALPPRPLPGFALPGVDSAAGLARVRGNEALYATLLRSFRSRNRDLVGTLRSLLAGGEIERLRQRAHTVTGVAGNLGALRLARAAHALEQAASARDGAAVGRDEIESRLRPFEAALTEVLDGIDANLAGAEDLAADGVAAAAADGADDRHRLLIADDAPENLRILLEALKHRYAIDVTRSGRQALALAAADPQPDLILLAVLLPDMDGYAVCRRLKDQERTHGIPVVFLTSLDSVEDEATGLEAGAADYIAKPIALPILDLRVKLHLDLLESRRRLERQNRQLLKAAKQREDIDHILRNGFRMAPGQTQLDPTLARLHQLLDRVQREGDRGALVPEKAVACRFGDWRLDLEDRALRRTDGTVTALTRHEFLVLQAFVENAGRTVTRPALLQTIGHGAAAGNDRAVDGLVHRLRRKLQEDPRGPRLIRSEHGQGNRFSAAVTWETGSGGPPVPDP